MKRYKQITVTKNQIDKVVCNGCGKELDSHTDYLSVDKKWGYGTSYDGDEHSFDLCEDCYGKIINGFKIAPDNND